MLFVVAVMFLTKIIIETPLIFDAFLLMLALVGAYEMTKILNGIGRTHHNYLVIAFPLLAYVLMFLGITLKWPALAIILSIVGLVVLLTLASALITLLSIAHTENEMRVYKVRTSKLTYAFQKGLNGILGYAYPSILILLLVPMNHLGDLGYIFGEVVNANLASIIFLALCFFIPGICDTFAYFTGGIIGGKKLAPAISPKKTISGAVGGVLWTVLLIIVLFLVFSSIPTFASVFMDLGITWWSVAILALLGAVACVIGDLFESLLKRKAGIKDSGEIFPGHGGMLDRLDGFMFVAVVVFVFVLIL